MTWFNLAATLVATIVVLGQHPAAAPAADKSDFEGRWRLNRELSQFPREIGFGVDWVAADGTGVGSTQGGRGRRGPGGAQPFIARRESVDDAKRLQLLTAEARNPSSRLTIVDTPTSFSITDDRGQTRTFHPSARAEVVDLDGVSVGVTAKREPGRLVVLYSVEEGRELRYTYSRAAPASQLTVEIQFVEHGGGDSVRRIYEPAGEDDPPPPPTAPVATVTKADALSPAGSPAAAGNARAPAPAPASQVQEAAAQNQQPGAELKGITRLGTVVEELSPEAAACGLKYATLETAVSKHLSDAGFKVLRNSDEDTYLYVNVNTASVSTGLCVSRYDVFLYTHATAKLSYQQTPVLVQVALLHEGGIAGGAPAAHAENVLRNVQQYVDQFAKQIRQAGQ